MAIPWVMPRRRQEGSRAQPTTCFPRTRTLSAGFAALVFLFLLALILPPPAFAQTNTLRFERISTQQGLSQNTVNAIVQDREGFMWFGTEGGLNRYDGYQFTVYRHDPGNAKSLTDDDVRSLYEDRTGVFWVGTTNGLDRYEPASDTFTHYAHDPNDPTSLGGSWVTAICEDQTGMLWVGTEEEGLDRFDPSTGKFTHYRHSASNPGSLSDDAVRAIYLDHAGTLWIGTHSGLDRFDPTTATFAHYRQSPHSPQIVNDYQVLSILEHKGDLWIGTESGLVRLDRRSGHYVEYRNVPDDDSSLGNNSVACVYEDSEGVLWLGTRAGLDRLDEEQNRFVHYRYDRNDPHSLSGAYVNSIYQDRSGVLWIGMSDGGLSKYSPSGAKFDLYQSRPGVSNGLTDNNVWAVREDRDGILWIGTFFAGLNALDRQSGAVQVYRHNPNQPGSLLSDEIRAILEDSAGNLWVGTEHGGLDQLDRGTGTFVHYQHDSNNPASLSDTDVFAIYEDREHRLWVGTQNGGLDRLNASNGTFVHYLHDANDPASLSNDYVGAIYQDKQGDLWVGTWGGLDRWDSARNQFVHYRNDPQNPSSLSGNMVSCITQDAEGVLWVGTHGAGLNRFDRTKQTFTHYTMKDGLPDDIVYGILTDGQGFLWLSTSKGVSRFDPRTATFRNYTASDGLQGGQFNPRAYFKSQAGEMFFGGAEGLNAFYPNQVHDSSFAPPVVLTAFKKLNQPVQLDLTAQKPVPLAYQDYMISFEFAALDFNAPDKNQYAYKLAGVDPDWVYAGTRHYATYTNLRAGDYVFWVKASNSDAVWGPAQAILAIQVVPPFWETWWFRGGLAAVLAFGVIAAYRIRMQGARARRRELESRVEQRTRELATLNTIAEVVSGSLDLKEIMNAALTKAMEAMRMDVGTAYSIQEDEGPDEEKHLAFAARKGLSPEFAERVGLRRVRESGIKVAAETQKPVVWLVANYPDPSLKQALEREGVRQVINVPLFAKGRFVGAFNLGARVERPITREEISLLDAIGHQVAIAVENAHLYDQAEQSAALAERNRLARELHDSVTQSLYSVTLFGQAAAEALSEGETKTAAEHLNELRETVQEALGEMRLLIFQLHPPALEKNGLVAALQTRLEAVETRGGMQAELQVEGSEQPDPKVQEELYNIAQEALNNALKHAHARRVRILLRFEERITGMDICDDGVGFEPKIALLGGGFGLSGMAERAQKIGATLQVESSRGHGTVVTVRVPRESIGSSQDPLVMPAAATREG